VGEPHDHVARRCRDAHVCVGQSADEGGHGPGTFAQALEMTQSRRDGVRPRDTIPVWWVAVCHGRPPPFKATDACRML